MESCTKDNVIFCLIGCLQCLRCILQTPIDSKRSTHHRDAPQHSMLATAWINYKNTASYFPVSLSSNGITLASASVRTVTTRDLFTSYRSLTAFQMCL